MKWVETVQKETGEKGEKEGKKKDDMETKIVNKGNGDWTHGKGIRK